MTTERGTTDGLTNEIHNLDFGDFRIMESELEIWSTEPFLLSLLLSLSLSHSLSDPTWLGI